MQPKPRTALSGLSPSPRNGAQPAALDIPAHRDTEAGAAAVPQYQSPIPMAFFPVSRSKTGDRPKSGGEFNWLAHTSGMIGGRLYIAGQVPRGLSFDSKTLSPAATPEEGRPTTPRVFQRRHTTHLTDFRPFITKTRVETYGTATRNPAAAAMITAPGMAVDRPAGATPTPRPALPPGPSDQPLLIRRMSKDSGNLTEGVIIPDILPVARALHAQHAAAHESRSDTSSPAPAPVPAAAAVPPRSPAKSTPEGDAPLRVTVALSPADADPASARPHAAAAAEERHEGEGPEPGMGIGAEAIEERSVSLGWANWESYAARHFL